MTALASTDVTLTLIRKDLMSKGRLNTFTVAFGDGALTYPTNGVPLPVKGAFGFGRSIDHAEIQPPPGNGYVYKYDSTNHTVRIYQAAGFTPSGTVAAPVFTGTPISPGTPAGTVAAPVFTGTPISPGTPAGTVDAPVFTGTPASFTAEIYSWSLQNLKGADADVADSMTTDQNAGGTNDDLIDTFAAIAGGAWTYSENLEIDVPRNVVLTLLNDSGGPLNMEEAAFSAVITGTFRGQAQTDTITEIFTAGNKAIANTKFRWKAGVKPFDHITDVVVTGITANQNGIKIGIGPGRLLGVPVEPKDNLVGDFIKVTKNSADLAPVAYDDTNKTLDLGALADNDDLDIEIEVASLGESYTPAGTNSAPAFTGAAMANITPAGTNAAPAFTGAAMANITPAGTNSAPAFTGVAVAAAALAELGAVAVAATTLVMKLYGR